MLPRPHSVVALACALLAVTPLAGAQGGYRASLGRAEAARAAGRPAEAAEAYAAAYAARPGKRELAAAAAALFEEVGDYERAAAHYAPVAVDPGAYPRAGLRLARALKRLGRYDEAAAVLKAYREAYRGDDRAEVLALAAREVKGLQLARAEAERPSGRRRVVPFAGDVNDEGAQTAPMPLAPGAVYYLTEGTGGRAEVWRASRADGTWGGAAPAEQFPPVPGYELGAGSLGPTGDRFYVGLCRGAACGIYVIVRGEGGAWAPPVALPSYINVDGATTSHPYAYREGDREVLLFASDRPGGLGGTDLYRAERAVASEANDFTFPESLGEVVNSPADEITPFYDPVAGALYFASDDGAGLGGFDVYRAEGDGVAWSAPANLLAPVNGPGDEHGYRVVPERPEAVLASTRPLPTDTADVAGDLNLFAVVPGAPTTPAALSVLDSATGRGVGGVTLAAYRGEALVASARAEDGYFRLDLPLGADLRLVLRAPDYDEAEVTVRTPGRPSRSFQLPPVKLSRGHLTLREVRRRERERGGPVERVPVAIAGEPVAPVEPGVTYRIQLEARQRPRPTRSRYASLAEVGEVSGERLERDGLYRVFVGDFGLRAEAAARLDQVEAAGFPGAFVVEFVDGAYRGVSRPPAGAKR